MNSFNMEDITVGMEQSFTVTVTEAMVQSFMQMSGDVNPLHTDKEYAANAGYSNIVVYGMLTASFYSTLAGVYLPGANCLLYEVDSQFTKPVFPKDTLTVSGKVSEVNSVLHCITMKATIRNQRGEKVSRAKIVAGIRGQGE